MRFYKSIWVFAISVLFVTGCVDVPEEIIIPEWDVDLVIPVTNRTYTLDEIIGDQENIDVDPEDSIFILHTREYTQTRGMLQFIKLRDDVTVNNIILPPLNGSQDLYMDFRNDVFEVQSAVFASGMININIRNNSSLTVTTTVSVPGISLNGIILSLSSQLGPGQNGTISQDLTGYTYREPPDQSPENHSRLWLQVESQSSGTNTSGLMGYDFSVADMAFSSVTGTFSEQDLGVQTDTIDADFGDDLEDFRNKVTLGTASLLLRASYQTQYQNPFDFRIDSLTLAAHSPEGEVVYLTDSTGSRYLNFRIIDGNVNLHFNQSNSNIEDLVNLIPDVFILSGSVKIIGNNQTGTVTNQDLTSVLFDIRTTSILAVAKSTVTDTLELDIKEDDREEIRKAKSGSIDLQITNALPVTGWVSVSFMDSLYNTTLIVRIENSDSLMIEGAGINIQTGEVTVPSTTIKTLEISEQDIINFSNAYYFSTSVTVETSEYNSNDPPLVKIKASDWMRINIIGKVRYEVRDLGENL